MVVNDVIITAMQIIGALSTGQSPSADDQQVVFSNLNALLDGWNTERLNLYVPLPFTGNLVTNQQSYQIGPAAADFPTTNSVALIQTAALIEVTGQTGRSPITILNSEEWSELREKGLTGYFPERLWCDYGYPISNILVHPIPNRAVAIELYLWTILTQFVSVFDTFSFRPGYLEAIQYNLAVKIAPQFGLAQDQTNVQLAVTYKQRIQDLNKLAGFPVPPMQQAMGSQPPAQPPAQ